MPSPGEEENDGDSFFPGFVILFRGVLFLTKHPFCSMGYWGRVYECAYLDLPASRKAHRTGIYPELLSLPPASLLRNILRAVPHLLRVVDLVSLLSFSLGGGKPATPTLPYPQAQPGSEPTGEAGSKGSFLHTWHRPQHRSGQAFRSVGTTLELHTPLGLSDTQEVKILYPGGGLRDTGDARLVWPTSLARERLGCLQLEP